MSPPEKGQPSPSEKTTAATLGTRREHCTAHVTGQARKLDLPALKARLPEYLDKIGTEWTLRGSKIVAKCPLHEDHNPSFEAEPDASGAWVWYCHPCGCGGTAIDLHQRRTGLTNGQGIADLARILGEASASVVTRPVSAKVDKAPAGLKLPDDLHRGTDAELRELAALRHVSTEATLTASNLGVLWFGTVCGFRSWILTDTRRVIAEARRMDGKPFAGTLGERKAHTIAGSKKSWPVGISPEGFTVHDFRAIMLVEGAPDYLAALHFATLASADVLPVAFLGTSVTEIHPEAARMLANRRVRLYPHVDPNGAGMKAAATWKAKLTGMGAQVDWLDMSGLTRDDGQPVKDLNDLCRLHPDGEQITPQEVIP